MIAMQAVGRILTPPWEGRLLVSTDARNLSSLSATDVPFVRTCDDKAARRWVGVAYGVLPAMQGVKDLPLGYVLPPFVAAPVAVYEKKQVVDALAQMIDGGAEDNLDMLPLIRPCFLVIESFFSK